MKNAPAVKQYLNFKTNCKYNKNKYIWIYTTSDDILLKINAIVLERYFKKLFIPIDPRS